MSGPYENKLLLQTQEQNPTIALDSVQGYARGNRFGEQVTNPINADFHAMEGTYFTTSTVLTTGATGIAGHPAPVLFEGIKPYLYVKNNNAVASGIKMTLKAICLRWTAVGAGGTLQRWWSALEPNGTNRYTSGGTQLLVVNARGGSSKTSNAVIFQGVVVSPVASANVRPIKAGQVRPVIPVIYDELNFVFGQASNPSAQILSGTLVAQQTIAHPPVVLDPGDQFLLSLWRVSQSGADSLEADMAWIER